MSNHDWFGGQYLGRERSRAGHTTFHATNPQNGERLPGAFVEATKIEIADAGQRAQEAFEQLNDVAPANTAAFLLAVAAALEDDNQAIIARADAETGLGRPRLEGELGRTTGQLRMFADLARDGSWVDARIDRTAGPDLRRMRIPLGPVAVFGASNFPLAFSVAGGDSASAWAAGCPVIVKAHPAHPGTSELVANAITRAAESAGVPAAIFQMIQGASHEAGRDLVMDPHITAVGFTGSFRGGMALQQAAAERGTPIPVFAEMGSVNPVFLLPNALKLHGKEVSRALADSVMLGTGQYCTNPGLLIGLASEPFEAWLDELASHLEAGAPAAMLTPPMCSAYQKGVERLASTTGVSRLTSTRDTTLASPALFRATAATFLAQPSLGEENFGPSSLAVVCEGERELLHVATSLPGSLTATLRMTDSDTKLARRLLPVVAQRVGRVLVNGVPTGVAVSPAMQHGGPYPATTDPRFTSVGTAAIERFSRPICLQDMPEALLPLALRNDNPLGIRRWVDGSDERVNA